MNPVELMDHYGSRGRPFLFVIGFDMEDFHVMPLDEIDPRDVLYDLRGITNAPSPARHRAPERPAFRRYPLPYGEYRKAFDRVVDHERQGDSYLVNLTFPTPVEMDISLRDLFHISGAPYRLWFRGLFTVFSPEPFVRIGNNRISSYPMKGTIDASVPDAEAVILADAKEFAEHLTIVDLIRNDLNMVSEGVTVGRFRYVERVRTYEKELLQVSSEIHGVLPPGFEGRIGGIVTAMLPAGSVTGAPKKKTVEIIRSVEKGPRGYYTGVFGLFDGSGLDSAVMIRFIEQGPRGLLYRSGGGITVYSDPEAEYRELVDKVYVPAG